MYLWKNKLSLSSSIYLYCCASSLNGKKLFVGTSNNYMYVSNDSGDHWDQRGIIGNWSSVVSSYDGTKLAACLNSDVYTSDDSGETWTDRNQKGDVIASSSDGSKLLTFDNSTYSSYISIDSGLNWNLFQTGGYPTYSPDCVYDKDATNYIVALNKTTTLNYGKIETNLAQLETNIRFSACCISFNGSNLAACTFENTDGAGYIWTSDGVDWTQRYVQKYWVDIACSNNGRILFAINSDDSKIHISNNYGVDWTYESLAEIPIALALNGNSKKILLITAHNIYIGNYIFGLKPTLISFR